jgi:very-short-patch-repair endonuclease
MNWELFLFLFALGISLLAAAAFNTKREITGTDWSQRRKCGGAAERILFDELARHNFRMLTQVPVGKRQKVDFFLLDYDIAIEVDSTVYSDPEIQNRMNRKDASVREKGWEVIRVSAADVRQDVDGVVSKILTAAGWYEEAELTAEPEPVPE